MSAYGALAAMALAVIQSPAAGQQAASPEVSPSRESTRKLAQAVANPLATVATLTLEFDWDSGIGPDHSLRTTLNAQSQVPVALSEDWTLLSRLVLPFISQPAVVRGGGSTFGFGDMGLSMFLTPSHAPHLVWGIGPAFGLPMSSRGTWQAGPTGGVVLIEGAWQLGVVAAQLWPFADTTDNLTEHASHTFVHALTTYTAPHAVTFTLDSETTIDWTEHGERKTTVPISFLVSRLRLGFLPVSPQIGASVFLNTPTGGPDWSLRLAIVVVVPQKE